MKKIIILTALFAIATNISIAQGNGKAKNADKSKSKEKTDKVTGNDKEKSKEKDKDKEDKIKHEKGIWEGTSNSGGGPKASKNQPAKVRQAFSRDYPNAGTVSWSKYRGDWTATFRNGFYWSTAVYHANGDRRDTRTLIPRTNVPVKIEDIFKKRPDTRWDDVIKIETPKVTKDIFRIKTVVGNATQYLFYNVDGEQVQYNY